MNLMASACEDKTICSNTISFRGGPKSKKVSSINIAAKSASNIGKSNDELLYSNIA